MALCRMIAPVAVISYFSKLAQCVAYRIVIKVSYYASPNKDYSMLRVINPVGLLFTIFENSCNVGHFPASELARHKDLHLIDTVRQHHGYHGFDSRPRYTKVVNIGIRSRPA